MSNIGFAFIGTPDGLQIHSNGILEGRRIGGYVDLPNRLIKLITPNDSILSVIREYDGSDLITYFIMYKYALEIDRNRTGTFLGSVVALKNCKASGQIIYMMLVELAAQVAAYTQPDTGKFLANFEDIPFRNPYHLSFIESSLTPIGHMVPTETDRACFIYGPKSKFSRSAFLEAALIDESLSQYQRCFFSESSEVDNYVRDQGGLDYFTKQESHSGHLLTFARSGKIVQLNLMPTSILLEEMENLKQENIRLREEKKQLEKIVAEGEKKKESAKVGEHEETNRDRSAIQERTKSVEQEEPVLSSLAEMNLKQADTQSSDGAQTTDSNANGIKTSTEPSLIIQFISRFLLIVRFFLYIVLAFMAIALVAILILDKDIPYISNLLPRWEQQDTHREHTDYTIEQLPTESREEEPQKEENSLSEKQQEIWTDTEKYLNEIKSNLDYEPTKMNKFKTQMEKAGMSDFDQYKDLMKTYNNYKGSGQPFNKLQDVTITPSKLTKLELIATDTLTVGRLASFLIDNCPKLSAIYTQENMEQVIINSNPNDINHDSKIIPSHNSSIMLYIPESVTNCDLN